MIWYFREIEGTYSYPANSNCQGKQKIVRGFELADSKWLKNKGEGNWFGNIGGIGLEILAELAVDFCCDSKKIVHWWISVVSQSRSLVSGFLIVICQRMLFDHQWNYVVVWGWISVAQQVKLFFSIFFMYNILSSYFSLKEVCTNFWSIL